jgi:hypothetical protein
MKNITKGLLSIFASVVIASSAFAGEVSVTGTAAVSYHISSSWGLGGYEIPMLVIGSTCVG